MHAARRSVVTAATTVMFAALLPSALAAPNTPAPGTGADSARAQVADEVGRWRVASVSPGTYELTWRAPEPLPVTDARAEFHQDDTVLGTPRLSADGRTLALTVGSDAAPRTGDLDVVLSGRRLDSTEPALDFGPGDVRRLTAAPTVAPPPAGRTLAADPGTPGPRRVVTSDYRLPAARIAGMRAPIEMLGHVVRPAGTATERPLVLFLHGRHQPCFGRPTGSGRRIWPCPAGMRPVPSHLGYDYAQRLLASRGYVTVSVSANGINAQDFVLPDGGAAARATLVRRHLAQWTRWAAQGRFAVDMSKVVLVGHSRGGEGVDLATVRTSLAAPYRIVGQLLLAPTNFARRTAAYVPTVTVLPYCDGDVADLQGQTYTDVARDLTGDDTALHSSVMMMGANHNFFNTEWTPGISVAPSFDDGRFLPGALCKRSSATRMSPGEQRAAGRTYIAGAVALMADGDSSVLEMFDGSDVEVPSARGADVRTHTVGLGRDLRRPGTQATLSRPSGATTRLCLGRSGTERAATCGRGIFGFRTPHWVPDFFPDKDALGARAFEMSWTRAGGTGGLRLRQPMDLSAATGLDLRTAVDPRRGHVRMGVRVYDGTGASALLTAPQGRLVPALPGRDPFVLGKVWAQTLRVPLAAATGVDLTDVRRVELVGASIDGRVWVLDLSATQAGPAAVPVRRLARVDLGSVRLREGDGARERVVRVPVRVQGVLREPARLLVLVFSETALRSRTIDLAAGQQQATVAVRYTPDKLDDLPGQGHLLVLVPIRGAMPNRELGRVRIVDDDPAPRVRVRRVAPRASEGGAARWRVTLSRPVDYHAAVLGRVVHGSTSLPRLRAGDVTTRWLENHTFPVPAADTPLHKARPVLFSSVRPGRTTAGLAVPLRRDGVAEGPEAVTLRIRVPRLAQPVDRAVTVVD